MMALMVLLFSHHSLPQPTYPWNSDGFKTTLFTLEFMRKPPKKRRCKGSMESLKSCQVPLLVANTCSSYNGCDLHLVIVEMMSSFVVERN